MRGAVLGDPIAHSLSPRLYAAGAGISDFSKIKISAGELADFLEKAGTKWDGFAVTMPLKREAFNCADMADDLAQKVQVVNTLICQPLGKSQMFIGFNTDIGGIVNAITEIAPGRSYKKALILGSGATASSALAALAQLEVAEIEVCARRLAGPRTVFTTAHNLGVSLSTHLLEAAPGCIQNTDLLISTLPAGVADKIASQITGTDLTGKFLLDVAYDPYPSRLVTAWQAAGGNVIPGKLMLLHQAILQMRLFTGKDPDVEQMRQIL